MIFKVYFVSLQSNAATIYVEMEDHVENIFPRVTRGVHVHEDFLGDIVKIVNLKCCSHTGISPFLIIVYILYKSKIQFNAVKLSISSFNWPKKIHKWNFYVLKIRPKVCQHDELHNRKLCEKCERLFTGYPCKKK